MTATSHAESPAPRHTWGAVLAVLAAHAATRKPFMAANMAA